MSTNSQKDQDQSKINSNTERKSDCRSSNKNYGGNKNVTEVISNLLDEGEFVKDSSQSTKEIYAKNPKDNTDTLPVKKSRTFNNSSDNSKEEPNSVCVKQNFKKKNFPNSQTGGGTPNNNPNKNGSIPKGFNPKDFDNNPKDFKPKITSNTENINIQSEIKINSDNSSKNHIYMYPHNVKG